VNEYPSVEEAEEIRLSLLEEVQDIDRQLTERAATAKAGWLPQSEYAEYLDWRKRAIGARMHLLNEMRDAKEFVKKVRREHCVGSNGDPIAKARDLAFQLLDVLAEIGAQPAAAKEKGNELLGSSR
jgi:hypothetical protein